MARNGQASAIIPIAAAFKNSEGAVKLGLKREALFQESFIEPASQSQITFAQLGLLYANIMAQTEDHFVGLARRPSSSAQLALMLRIMIACSSVGRALDALVHFHASEHMIQLGVSVDQSECRLCVYCDDDYVGAFAPIIEDSYIQSLFAGLSYFLGRPFPATFVSTRNAGHPMLGVRTYGIDAPLHLAKVAALYFPPIVMTYSRQTEPTDDIFWDVVENWLGILNGSTTRGNGQSASLRELNTTALCDDLGISTATFRRRNTIAGHTFRRFREETLVEASLELLSQGTRSVASIAAELGYSDVRSYRRFIKSATGMTPDQLRTRADCALTWAVEPRVVAKIKELTTRLSR